MKKIKLDPYDLGIVINGLYSYRQSCTLEVVKQIDSLLLWLMDIFEKMKPGRKKKIELNSDQISLIMRCLNEWRNSFLSDGNNNKAEAVTETLIKFIK